MAAAEGRRQDWWNDLDRVFTNGECNDFTSQYHGREPDVSLLDSLFLDLPFFDLHDPFNQQFDFFLASPTLGPEIASSSRSNTLSAEPRPSNEASPPSQHRQEMESSGPGALAAPVLPENPHTPQAPAHGVTQMSFETALERLDQDPLPLPFPELTDRHLMTNFNFDNPIGLGEFGLGAPKYPPPVGGFADSSMRENAVEEQHQADAVDPRQLSPTSSGAAMAASTLANFTSHLAADNFLPFVDAQLHDQGPVNLDVTYTGEADVEAAEDPTYTATQAREMAAYAKLSFGDGDYFIHTTQVELGRDNVRYQQIVFERKRKERAAERARQTMQQYAQEPSAPSHPGDGDDPSSKSSDYYLEGRPAGALPSNYSEQGGAVVYEVGSDDNNFDAKRRRRKDKRTAHLQPKSSSSISVVPADLSVHNYQEIDQDTGEDGPSRVFIPIHPSDMEDFKRISKKHLMVAYDQATGQWMLHVLGATATLISGDEDAQDLRRGEVVPLQAEDEVQVHSFTMTFRLPETEQRLSPSGHSGPSHLTCAESDLSEAEQSGAEDQDAEEEVVETKRDKAKRPPIKRLKLNLNKKKSAQKDEAIEASASGKKGGKGKKKEEPVELSPEAAKKPDKGKKPKAAAKEPALAEPSQAEGGAEKTEEVEKPKKPSPQPPPINIEPGSILHGLAPEELPQRRKGPGRPPKNGVISKRDASFIKRKQREYEKEGKIAPSVNELLPIVRWEQKQREAEAKAKAAGQAPPPQTEMPVGVVQSIENAEGQIAGSSAPAPNVEGAAAGANGEQRPSESVPAEGAMRRPSSPRPKRVAKTPSPVPPESSFTEEQLKKPNMTYVLLLDSVLRDIVRGDLQDIYDRIMKKWPHYKYKVDTVGWQSSVRHNLLSNPRFKADGNSGKGKLWAINWEVPLEREKKRPRVSPPAVKPPMPNGQYAPGQYPPYGAYGQPGVPPQQFAGGQQQMANGAYASPYPYGQQQHGQQPGQQQQQSRPTSQTPANTFQPIVDQILAYRQRYLAQWPINSPQYNAQADKFSKCTNFVSEMFHGGGGKKPDLPDPDEKMIYENLEGIMKRFEHIKKASRTPSQQPGESSGSAAVAGVQASAQAQTDGQAQVQTQAQGQTQGGAAVANPQPNGPAQVQPQGQMHSQAPAPVSNPQSNGPAQGQLQRQAPTQAPTTVANAQPNGAVPGQLQGQMQNQTPAPVANPQPNGSGQGQWQGQVHTQAPTTTANAQPNGPVQGQLQRQVQTQVSQPNGPVAMQQSANPLTTPAPATTPSSVPAPASAPVVSSQVQVQAQATPVMSTQPVTSPAVAGSGNGASVPPAAPVQARHSTPGVQQTTPMQAHNSTPGAQQAAPMPPQGSSAAPEAQSAGAGAGIKRAASGDEGDAEQDAKRIRTDESRGNDA